MAIGATIAPIIIMNSANASRLAVHGGGGNGLVLAWMIIMMVITFAWVVWVVSKEPEPDVAGLTGVILVFVMIISFMCCLFWVG